MNSAPTLGCRESTVPNALRKTLVLRDPFERRSNPTVNGEALFDPGHGVLAPAPLQRAAKGKDDEFPEGNAFNLGPRKACRYQTVKQLRHDKGIGVLQDRKERHVILPVAYSGPRVGARGQAFADLFKRLVGLHKGLIPSGLSCSEVVIAHADLCSGRDNLLHDPDTLADAARPIRNQGVT